MDTVQVFMALWTQSQEEDDFFGNDESVDADELGLRCHDGYDNTNGLAAQEAAALEEQYRTLGYHETYETSQEETMQEGFISGYKETFDIAMYIGTLLGQAAAGRLQFSRQTTRRITLQEKETCDGGIDGPFEKAIARTREVLSATTAQEPAAPLPVPASQGDDMDGISARSKPLTDLQMEVERLLSDYTDESE